MKKRHSWGELQDVLIGKTKVSEKQKCVKCGIFRSKALGIWMYSSYENKGMLTESIPNKGCI